MPLLGEVDRMPNPVEKYVKWKGKEEDGLFVYYDKDKKEEVEYKLKDFIIVAIGYKVGGYNKVEKSFIYSNEIDKLFKDKFVVKYSGGGEIGVGKYKEIKDKIKSAGGRLNIVLTVYTNGELIQFMLKGEAYYAFSELLKKVDRNRQKVKFTGKKLVKDKVGNYNLPQFEKGEDFEGTPEYSEACDYTAKVSEYRAFLKNKYADEIDAIEEEEEALRQAEAEEDIDKLGGDVDDDLPF